MNFNRLVVSSFLALSLSGCIIVSGDHGDFDHPLSSKEWEDVERSTRAAIADLTIGDNYNLVKERLGKASFSEAFQMGDATYQVLYYRTHRVHSDGKTTKDETTPVIFKDNQLIGWGEEALNQVR